jgi:hypothetical protein
MLAHVEDFISFIFRSIFSNFYFSTKIETNIL